MLAKLLIIDPQNDFVGLDDGSPLAGRATLPVKGASSDLDRLAVMLRRTRSRLGDIVVTLDSHHPIDVAHPAMWRDRNNQPPKPFTLISAADVRAGVWLPRLPSLRDRMISYTEALEAAGKYQLIIWPEHCLVGTWGHSVYENLMAELLEWERAEFANVGWVTKGSNPYTEHYGGIMAEVPDPGDPTTQLNADVLTALQEADVVGIAGEASSHCVLATVNQVVANIGDDHLSKIHLITDCMSPVPAAPGTPDFPAIAAQFMRDMERRGLRLTTSGSFLK
jgi:nicotinamidase-related amidase